MRPGQRGMMKIYDVFIGWKYKGKLVHCTQAYLDIDDWLSSFEYSFPDVSKKMHDYSSLKEWGKKAHNVYWARFLEQYFNKNCKKHD